jgi:transcriptional regulator with XRE-family HTH domain
MDKAKRLGRTSLMKDFALRLRTIRLERGLSQRQLAEIVGCETMLISRYERGTGLPKMDTLVSLARALRISLDELATGAKASAGGPEAPIRNVLLLERFRDLEGLPREDQSVAIKLLDALIAARSVETAVARARRTA